MPSKLAYEYAAAWLEVDCDSGDIEAETYDEEERLREEIRDVVDELRRKSQTTED